MIEEIKHSIEGLVDNVEDILWNIDIDKKIEDKKNVKKL